MRLAVRVCFAGLALALLFWFSLAPGSDRGTSPTPPAPHPTPGAAATDGPPSLVSEPRRSEPLLPTASAPAEILASAPTAAVPGRYAFDVLVIDDEARPVEGATVTAFTERTIHPRTTRVPIEPPAEWKTDASGRCAIQVPLPRRGVTVGLHLAAEKPGVGCSEIQWIAPESPTQVRLVLLAPVWIEGRVIGADLRPAADATVHLSREHGLEGEEEGLPSPLSVGAEGRFAAEIRAGGQFEVWAERAGRRSEVVRVHSSPGSRHEITFWLGALTIEGVLRDPAGNTVPRGTVRAWDQARREWSGGPDHGRPWGTTGGDADEHGNYRIAVPAPGSYLVAGVAQGFASSLPREVSVEEDNPHPRVDLTLFEPASISGVVRGESGQPTPDVRLQALPEPNANPMAGLVGRSASAVFRPFAEGRSTEDGSFEFVGLHPSGSYTIRHLPGSAVPGAWGVPKTLLRGVRAGMRGLEIVMKERDPRACPVRGTVLGPGDAGPARAFSVSLHCDLGDGHWGNLASSNVRGQGDGRFSIEGAIAGERHVLRASSASPAGQTFARVDPWIARPEGNEFTLRLRSSGSLECRVVDRTGRPVPFAEVNGGPYPPFPGSQDFLPERTDESGTARLKGLEPAGYRIRAWKGNFSSEPVEVEVLEGARQTATIVIPR